MPFLPVEGVPRLVVPFCRACYSPSSNSFACFPSMSRRRQTGPAAREIDVPAHRPAVPSARRWWQLPLLIGAIVAIAVAICCLSVVSVSTNDLWIHLKTGELILQTGSVPHKDPYSFTAAGHDYIAHEWLAGVLFYGAYAVLGVPGLILFKTLIILIAAALLGLVCFTHRDHLAIVLVAFGAMAYIAAARFLVRPHIFSYLMLCAYLFVFFRYRDGGRNRLWLAAVVPLQVLWANLHGGFIQGLALLVVFAMGEAVAWGRARLLGIRREDAVSSGDLTLLAVLPLVATAVSLINPYGFRLLEFPFQLTGMEVFMKDIFEWLPAFNDSFDGSYMFAGYWIWITVLFASFLFGNEKNAPVPWRAWVQPLNLIFLGATAIFSYCFMWAQGTLEGHVVMWTAVALLFCAVNVHRLDPTEVAIVAMMFAMSMKHNRAITEAVIVTTPILTHNLSRLADELGRRQRTAIVRVGGSRPVTVVALSLLLLAEGAHAQVFGYYYSRFSRREGGLGIADTMPVCSADYVVRRQLSGNAFTSYNTAGLLIFRRYPDVKVSMDSRNEVYGAELYQEFKSSRQSAAAMKAYLDKHRVDFFFVNAVDLSPQASQYLLGSGEWVQVYFDHQVVILVRNEPRFAEVIREDAYSSIFPSINRQNFVPPAQAEDYLREATRAASLCDRAWLPRWYRAVALARLGRYREATEAVQDLLKVRPDVSFAWTLLGNLYVTMQEKEKAIDAYQEALAWNPSYEPAHQGLEKLRSRR